MNGMQKNNNSAADALTVEDTAREVNAQLLYLRRVQILIDDSFGRVMKLIPVKINAMMSLLEMVAK